MSGGPSDEQLVEASAYGDVEAFAQLVRRYTNALCAIAYDVTGDYHLAQDIAQDAFVKAYRSMSSLRQPGKFASWLYTITMNLSIDHKRVQARKSKLAALAAVDSETQSYDRYEQQELRLDVRRALGQLDDISRTILLSYYISEMTMPEISRMLDMSVAAIESRLRRSRKQLKESDLSAWAVQYGKGAANDKLVVRVMERIVKQAGQFYIPVSNAKRSTDWFVTQLGLALDHNGHIRLPSGQTLFIIEVSNDVLAQRSEEAMPMLHFSIESTSSFYAALLDRGIRAQFQERSSIAGEHILFFDPDGNCFGASVSQS